MQQQSAIVVGAGFGGIAAARMRAKGYQVTLLDKGSQLVDVRRYSARRVYV